MAAHVSANKCRNRVQARHKRAREVSGPYLPTTMGGIQAAHIDIAAQAAVQPLPDLFHAPTLNFYHLIPGFAMEHLRTSWTHFAASLPGLSKSLVT